MWQNDNPHVVHHTHHQYRFSVNVWVGIVDNYVVRPYLLPSCLTGDVRDVFLREMLTELLEDVPLPIRRRMRFQQNGDPAHFS